MDSQIAYTRVIMAIWYYLSIVMITARGTENTRPA
jgi:hypothetical protein